jgi:hypothetical protein
MSLSISLLHSKAACTAAPYILEGTLTPTLVAATLKVSLDVHSTARTSAVEPSTSLALVSHPAFKPAFNKSYTSSLFSSPLAVTSGLRLPGSERATFTPGHFKSNSITSWPLCVSMATSKGVFRRLSILILSKAIWLSQRYLINPVHFASIPYL